jgi:hypothetical protein
MAVEVHGVTPVFASMRTIVPARTVGGGSTTSTGTGAAASRFLGDGVAETFSAPPDPVGKIDPHERLAVPRPSAVMGEEAAGFELQRP